MSFLKKLFGGGGDAKPAQAAKAVAEEPYRAFLIRATPVAEGGQFRLAGTISRVAGEGPADDASGEHRFVRADLFQTMDEAASATLRKGRQLIDEQGEALFKS